MLAMLESALVAVVIVLVVAVLAAVFTAVPFVIAVDMAERRRFSPGRWGALQLSLIALAGVLAFLALKHSAVLLLPAPFLCWLAPVALMMMSEQEVEVGGYQGAHEA